MNRIAVALIAFVAWTLLAFWAGWEWRDRSADLEGAKALTTAAQGEAKAQKQARTTEQASAQTLADIGTDHEEDRRDAETVPAAVAANLRAGNLRLRREWAGCETQRLSDAAAGAVERDALARLRAEAAGTAVRIVRDADDHVRACQAVVRADRAEVTP